MKGIVSALALFPNAAAALIGIFISPLSEDPTFAYVYAGAGTACIIAAVAFFMLFGKYDIEDFANKDKRLTDVTEGAKDIRKQEIMNV
jgi:POT family proton-dependent oligopeptide transporter